MEKVTRQTRNKNKGTGITTRRFRDVIPSVMASIQRQHDVRPDIILASWPQVVGPKIAKFTRPESFIEGILKVKVNNSTLLSLLRQTEKAKLLANIRRKFPQTEVADILFYFGE